MNLSRLDRTIERERGRMRPSFLASVSFFDLTASPRCFVRTETVQAGSSYQRLCLGADLSVVDTVATVNAGRSES